jgi:hypothetical protein
MLSLYVKPDERATVARTRCKPVSTQPATGVMSNAFVAEFHSITELFAEYPAGAV